MEKVSDPWSGLHTAFFCLAAQRGNEWEELARLSFLFQQRGLAHLVSTDTAVKFN